MTIKRFEDIVAWQRARILTTEIHSLCKTVNDRAYKDQLFRAALSIMNNIAEGFDRGTDKELKHFLLTARGSCAEVRSMLLVAVDLGYVEEGKQKYLLDLSVEISKLLSGFIRKLSAPKTKAPVTYDYRLMTND